METYYYCGENYNGMIPDWSDYFHSICSEKFKGKDLFIYEQH